MSYIFNRRQRHSEEMTRTEREEKHTHSHEHTPACPSMGHPPKTAGEEKSKAYQIYLEVHWSRCEEEEEEGRGRRGWNSNRKQEVCSL